MLSQPSLMAIIETLWQARLQKKSSKSRRWSAVSTIPFVRKYIKNLALRPSVPQKWGHDSFLRPLKGNNSEEASNVYYHWRWWRCWLLSHKKFAEPGARSALARSEERRVGKECRSRGSPYH